MLKFALVLVLASLTVYGLPGGFQEMKVDDAGVVLAAKDAVEKLSNTDVLGSEYYPKLIKIFRARKSDVRGKKYKLNIIVGMTTCKKSDMKFADSENCGLQDNDKTYRICEVINYKQGDVYYLLGKECEVISKDDV